MTGRTFESLIKLIRLLEQMPRDQLAKIADELEARPGTKSLLASEDCDQAACEARAEFAADALGIEPPARLFDAEGGVAQDFARWGLKNGICLNFVFTGDLRGLVRDAAESRKKR